jgi:alkylation response protein AidB-like acyl-CoA dehydrogenase
MADLLPTAEQQELTRSLARLLASEAEPFPLLAELGWLGIGNDLPLVEQALVAREFGRALAPLQALAAIAGARLAALAEQSELGTEITSGAKPVCLLVSARVDEAFLVDDEGAELALRVTPRGASLHAIGQLRERAPLTALDDSLALSRATISQGLPFCLLDGAGLHREMLVLAAAYATGLCEAVCAMASEYARAREQFGQAIGAFQAIKHRCADMAIRADAAWSQTLFAALSADRADGDYQALSAFIVAVSYAIDSAQENIQLHGAIGITEELAAHRYLKRAHIIDMAFGPIARAREALLACPDVQAASA